MDFPVVLLQREIATVKAPPAFVDGAFVLYAGSGADATEPERARVIHWLPGTALLVAYRIQMSPIGDGYIEPADKGPAGVEPGLRYQSVVAALSAPQGAVQLRRGHQWLQLGERGVDRVVARGAAHE